MNGKINEAVKLLKHVVSLKRMRYIDMHRSHIVSEESLDVVLKSFELHEKFNAPLVSSPDFPRKCF